MERANIDKVGLYDQELQGYRLIVITSNGCSSCDNVLEEIKAASEANSGLEVIHLVATPQANEDGTENGYLCINPDNSEMKVEHLPVPAFPALYYQMPNNRPYFIFGDKLAELLKYGYIDELGDTIDPMTESFVLKAYEERQKETLSSTDHMELKTFRRATRHHYANYSVRNHGVIMGNTVERWNNNLNYDIAMSVSSLIQVSNRNQQQIGQMFVQMNQSLMQMRQQMQPPAPQPEAAEPSQPTEVEAIPEN